MLRKTVRPLNWGGSPYTASSRVARSGRADPHRRRTSLGAVTGIFVGIDVSKARNAIAVADNERGGEVRFIGEVDASEANMRRVVQRIASNHERAHFCYEAGPTGYGLYRLIASMGHPCTVVAPSLIPRKPGHRVKTNRRDAIGLAKLLRAGELTAVWVPDPGHEAMRDLVGPRGGGGVTRDLPPAGQRLHAQARPGVSA